VLERKQRQGGGGRKTERFALRPSRHRTKLQAIKRDYTANTQSGRRGCGTRWAGPQRIRGLAKRKRAPITLARIRRRRSFFVLVLDPKFREQTSSCTASVDQLLQQDSSSRSFQWRIRGLHLGFDRPLLLQPVSSSLTREHGRPSGGRCRPRKTPTAHMYRARRRVPKGGAASRPTSSAGRHGRGAWDVEQRAAAFAIFRGPRRFCCDFQPKVGTSAPRKVVGSRH